MLAVISFSRHPVFPERSLCLGVSRAAVSRPGVLAPGPSLKDAASRGDVEVLQREVQALVQMAGGGDVERTAIRALGRRLDEEPVQNLIVRGTDALLSNSERLLRNAGLHILLLTADP